MALTEGNDEEEDDENCREQNGEGDTVALSQSIDFSQAPV